MTKKWALLFSGRGSNLEALLKYYSESWKHPPLLITNNENALGREKAKKFGLESFVFKAKDFQDLDSFLQNQNVECLFLLGYMKILPPRFLSFWSSSVFNLHPSLLPAYPGLKSIERAYEDRAEIGITIHRVSEGVDEGQILVQDKVFAFEDYKHLSLEEVKSLVHSKEHQMICKFIPTGEALCDS